MRRSSPGRPARTFVRVGDGVVTIGATGELDGITLASLVPELRLLSEVCVGELVVDLSGCAGVPAHLVTELVTVQAACQEARCRLTVRVHDVDAARMLESAGLSVHCGHRCEHSGCPGSRRDATVPGVIPPPATQAAASRTS